MRSRGLNSKHLKALELLKTHSVDEIVNMNCGFKRAQLFHLISGNYKAGPVAEEFSSRAKDILDKKAKEQEKRIREVKRDLEDKVFSALREIVIDKIKTPTERKKNDKYLKEMAKLFVSGRATYNVGSVSYSTGLMGEDLLNEFRKLTALADASLERRAVQSPGEGSAGLLPASSEGRDQAQEEGEAGTLPA